MNISIIGLGYIGLPTAVVFARAGHRVFGYDINENVINTLNSGKIHIREKRLEEAFTEVLRNGKFTAHTRLIEAEVYIIAVPTPFISDPERKRADLTYVEHAAAEVAKILKKNDLVILESTSPPGTTRAMAIKIANNSGLDESQFYMAYCPERVLPGNILYELENNDRIVGSRCEKSALVAEKLYRTIVKYGNIFITDDVTAEMCKLVENSYRDVNIAFANELSIICSRLEIDVTKLIALANKHPRVNILTPGIGVGGHCLAVDPYFIVELCKDEAKLIAQAREVNENKPIWIAQKIEERIKYNKDAVIGIFGLAYKPDIDDFRESPSIKLAKILMDKGYKVIACEPNTQESQIESINLYTISDTLSIADLCVVTLKHKEFIDNMDLIKKSNSLILC